jgi:hypothetical protein
MVPQKARGRNMSILAIDQSVELDEASSFQIRDILWTLGVCLVSVSLMPFVAFYVLLVA